MDNAGLVETVYANDAQDWLGTAHGTSEGETITLDLSKFDAEDHFPNGFIPSGWPLAKLTADPGLYAPYDPTGRVNEVQTITRTATGGNNDLSFDGGTLLAQSIVAATTAAQIKAMLVQLPGLDDSNVSVTGAAGGPFAIEFVGNLAGVNVPPIAIEDANATGGTVLIAQTTAGAPATAVNGQAVMRGHLLSPVQVRTGATRATGSLYWHGSVVAANLPAGHLLDAIGKAQVPQLRYK